VRHKFSFGEIIRMIAGYIKFFTRSVNGWILGCSAFLAGCMKSLVVILTQYSVGLMLTLLGFSEASLSIVTYLNSVSEITYAVIVIHALVCAFFTWYYLNSSLDPVVRVKEFAKDKCQLENLQYQVAELKEKSEKVSKAKKEIRIWLVSEAPIWLESILVLLWFY